jgi:hypothetical protein
MIDRRGLLTLGGLLGGLAAPENGEGAAVGVGQMSDRNVQDLVNALKSIGSEIALQHSNAEILLVRKSMTDYLRANGKFPDFVDVGIDVWLGVYDWHVRMQQALVLARDVNGRYTMMFNFTALVLRQDAVHDFIGIPYDNR